jgi:topoisomerase-4 subunit A
MSGFQRKLFGKGIPVPVKPRRTPAPAPAPDEDAVAVAENVAPAEKAVAVADEPARAEPTPPEKESVAVAEEVVHAEPAPPDPGSPAKVTTKRKPATKAETAPVVDSSEAVADDLPQDKVDGTEAAPAGGGADGPGGGTTSGGGGWREDGHLRRLIDDNFIQYASYVIRDRAIPDLADGLKPVQRRILHSLQENDDGKFIKVANIVGHTMQYHPHGDASIADALVTLVNKRYVIEGQGNFGNLLTGDPAAASRYIECRLTDLARQHLFNAELTRFVPSYDGRRKEPVALPAKLPLLLMMGAEGIAVGLSTRVLPHNFGELLVAQIAILQKKPFEIFPDFRQGGMMDVSEYADGTGRVRLRSHIEVRSSNTLVIRSVPYGATTDSVIASIEAAAKKKSLRIKSINDFTAEAVEIEIVLAPDQDPDKTIQALYAFTQCETALASRIVVIEKNRPVEMTLSEVLKANTRTLVKTLKRELEAERRNLLEQLHHKTLVQIFVEHRIYKRIEQCKTYPDVQRAVLDGVTEHRELLRRDVTTKDVEMLLGVKIKRISLYDMNKNRKDIEDILAGIATAEKNLGDLTAYAIRFLRGLIKKYAGSYPRQAEIVGKFDAIAVRKLTANELTLHHDADKGYIGHDVSGDELFQCSSLDKLMVVWGDGRYKVMNPPDKLFVENLQHCAIYDRDRVFVLVYRDPDGWSHIKRFTFGGAIMNKEYSAIPPGSELLYFSDRNVGKLYVKYAKRKGQRIHQQTFDLERIKVRGVKTRGTQMTSKTVERFHCAKPKGWSDKRSGPPGTFVDH